MKFCKRTLHNIALKAEARAALYRADAKKMTHEEDKEEAGNLIVAAITLEDFAESLWFIAHDEESA